MLTCVGYVVIHTVKEMVMEMLSKILDIKGFKVIHVETDETTLYLSLECESEQGICPHCGTPSQQVRVWYPRRVRDLPVSGKMCYLAFDTRYFDCVPCHTTCAESLDVVEAKRDDTIRYETHIFEQVRQATATYVAAREGLTDQVVTRIFLRQAKQRLPQEPFKGVVR